MRASTCSCFRTGWRSSDRTDAAGAFRFTDVPPRAYALRFRLPGGLVQFHPSVADLNSAVQITVLAAAETAVHESVMPHGTLGGRITTDSGQSAPGARVQLYAITGGSPLRHRADRHQW